ncbi:nucleotidyl transferase AbiEii/AbiGii toxin family protein [Kineosporia sp. A_224]|uniref:nucleotidyl transferase AbiEii/AbiGii toxin family protein n=1 Tax=Kineosporia sp. A_224 TaxID=1962180 RepID=UPI000B4ADD46|nr:nucleotidyl transferase AbiEii/AbiGii toxin family protein [Kineosporia sp. A_224]
MDLFHERLAQVGLAALGRYGFALAGGYAVQAHGLLERPSEDVDMFTTLAAEQTFPEAVRAAVTAYTDAGLAVEVLLENATFARLSVRDPAAERESKVELGIDWRQHPPILLDVGPVLARDDAVANKVCALYSRGQARDYIDVDAALRGDAYTRAELLDLAVAHDPGFDRPHFADALRAIARLPLAEFTAYGLRPADARALVARTIDWADQLR